MATAKVESTDVRLTLSLNADEAIVLAELLWFTQLGVTGKGKTASNIKQALDDAGFDPEDTPGWMDALNNGDILYPDSEERGIYWKE